MIGYVVCDGTGAVVRYGHCDQAAVTFQATQPGEVAVELPIDANPRSFVRVDLTHTPPVPQTSPNAADRGAPVFSGKLN